MSGQATPESVFTGILLELSSLWSHFMDKYFALQDFQQFGGISGTGQLKHSGLLYKTILNNVFVTKVLHTVNNETGNTLYGYIRDKSS
jgi:hypothetical protein